MRKSIQLTLSLILILLVANLFFLRAYGSQIFSDGFESGDFSAWTGTFGSSPPTISSSAAHHGSRSCIENILDPYNWLYGGTYKNFGFQSIVYVRFYINVTSITISSGNDITCPWLATGSGPGDWYGRLVALLIKNDAGIYKWELEYKNGGSFFKTVSAATVETNSWICVEIKCVVSTTAGEARLYIDGSEVVAQAGLDNGSIGLYQFDLAYSGNGNGRAIIYNDCVVVADTYIGPEDMVGPTFQNMVPSSIIAGTVSTFNCLIADDTNVSAYIFSTNNTGTWINDTTTAFSSFFNETAAWANITKTLNDTAHNIVSYVWYANDTSNNWSHSIQYDLTLSAIPRYLTVISPYGTPSGQGSYDNGSTAYATLDTGIVDHGNGTRRVFTAWDVDATGTNYSSSDPILMDQNKTAVANWKTQYYVTVASPYGSPVPSSGWYNEETPITSTVTSPQPGPTGTRHVCTGWVGTGSAPPSGTNTSTSFTISQPSNITWNWKTQYLLNVQTAPTGLSPQPTETPTGEPDSPNNWWYDASATMTLTAQTVTGYQFADWTVDGASRGSGVNPANVAMNGPHAAVANYIQTTPISVSISPMDSTIPFGMSVSFASTVTGGASPYTYQWYVDGNPVFGATSNAWAFTPTAPDIYFVQLRVIDSSSTTAYSENARVAVFTTPVGGYSIHISPRNTVQPFAAYAALVCLFGAVLAALRRKEK